MKTKYLCLLICLLFITVLNIRAEEKPYSKPYACIKIEVPEDSEKEYVFPFLSSLNLNFRNQLEIGDAIAVHDKEKQSFTYFYKNSESLFVPDNNDDNLANFAFSYSDRFKLINIQAFPQFVYLSGELILSDSEKEFFSSTAEYPAITAISLNAARDAIALTIDSGNINTKLQVFYCDLNEDFTVPRFGWKILKSDILPSGDDIICEDRNIENLTLRVYLVSKQTDENFNGIADAEEVLTDTADFADNSDDSANNSSVPPLPDGPPSENGFHRADLNENWQIEVSEVNRVIELYNSNRFYKLDITQPDGYAPENDYANRITSNFHTSDSNGDGRIDMREVMHTIHLYNGGLFYRILDNEFVPAGESPVDSDGDGLSDAWEIAHFGNLDQDGSGDFDGDGMQNIFEYAYNLNPTLDDSGEDPDSDNISNLMEFLLGRNPIVKGVPDAGDLLEFQLISPFN